MFASRLLPRHRNRPRHSGRTLLPLDHQADDAVGAARSPPGLLCGLRRGIARRCPACGEGPLFRGYLSVLPICPACGNDNEQYPSDDFAPYVTIFVVLHLMIPVLFMADRTWTMSAWFEGAIALPIFVAATLAILPFAKGGVIGVAWAFDVTHAR
jgi:uncharacterized protein (DUF983 family)